jgi:hypothetical protein
MRKSALKAAAAAMFLTFVGCYESEQPLGTVEQARVDKRLLGTWECRPAANDSEDRAELSVFPFDERQYYAEWREGDELTRLRSFATDVGAESMLNVKHIDDEGWIFIRYAFTANGVLQLSFVDEDALAGLDGPAALDAIRKRVRDRRLYSDLTVCSRR